MQFPCKGIPSKGQVSESLKWSSLIPRNRLHMGVKSAECLIKISVGISFRRQKLMIASDCTKKRLLRRRSLISSKSQLFKMPILN